MLKVEKSYKFHKKKANKHEKNDKLVFIISKSIYVFIYMSILIWLIVCLKCIILEIINEGFIQRKNFSKKVIQNINL